MTKVYFFRWENLLVNPNKFSLIHFGGIHGFTPKTIKANLVSYCDQFFFYNQSFQIKQVVLLILDQVSNVWPVGA